ncbi:acyloxyacyl hydrolase [Hydrogenimonas sp. SS33]|uniref:acyloxyacyl hydrolase n=1 Tax=Hydrogenimonas leucolamina TaxID=2954236 RepID=UPI00336BF654
MTLDYGQSQDGIAIYRIGLRRAFETHWFESTSGYLSGYWEGSLNYWNGKGDENYGIAFSPVFTYIFPLSAAYTPYVEAGAGVSLWRRVRMGSRNLSSAFLFEDRIGAGLRMNAWDFCLRFMHYSNADIKLPNDGIDIGILSVSYSF